MEEIKYLLLTIILETPVARIFLRKEKWTRVFFIVVCVNAISHPLAWQSVSRGVHWWLVEVVVALFEGLVLAWMFPRTVWTAFIAGVGMNVVSAAIGILI